MSNGYVSRNIIGDIVGVDDDGCCSYTFGEHQIPSVYCVCTGSKCNTGSLCDQCVSPVKNCTFIPPFTTSPSITTTNIEKIL